MRYEVKAVMAGQGTVYLELEANSEEEARLQVTDQGGMVLSVRRSFSGFSLKARHHFPLVHFSQELLSLQTAGLSLVEGIETLLEKEQDASNRKIIQNLLTRLYEGVTFSQALEEYPLAFPPLYIATVRASERTGDLPEALTRFISYQTQMDFVRKKLVGASIYPVLLLVVGFLVSIFLMVFVVPKFSAIYDDMGSDLPWLSLLLIKWGQFVHERGFELAVIAAAAVAMIFYTVSRSSFRAGVLRLLWRIPAIGEHMRVYQLARFYKTLGMLLRGGIPITQALEMVSGLLQSHLRPKVEAAAKHIREGKTISSAMEQEGLTTAVGNRMLRVGERTGLMGDMMERIGNFHDEEIARWVEWTTKLIEPLLMAFIGIIIGGIIILMYMPIFELAGSIN
ncbi:type II secretion system F family protein [Nitrosomonas sp. JL21]|uniref:type II secretion system F family protein n=1 Tax=Nitrosomonas sp. JL21 TaxID=153949 RepID=UPI00136A3828|nr:type II secretion system F family protein [Nitrosomonas sp. JL21]MBL8498093.1 type II secretion system F family protein [Nitrosomonas sp.]MCC7091869.1 type II secretion system F family protein [Nitrosomonas sp.]MXS76394.1 type II secretion system F family protein [Nitrosomonas sp. JL21]